AQDIFAQDFRAAEGGSEQAGEDSHGGGLAGAVGTDEAEDVAFFQDQVEGVEGGQRAIAFGEGARRDGGWIENGPGRRCALPRRGGGSIDRLRGRRWVGHRLLQRNDRSN